MTDNIRDFDFRKPCRLAISVERELLSWQSAVCTFISEQMTQLLHADSEWTAQSQVSTRPSVDVSQPEIYGFEILVGKSEGRTVLLIDRATAILLVESILEITANPTASSDKAVDSEDAEVPADAEARGDPQDEESQAGEQSTDSEPESDAESDKQGAAESESDASERDHRTRPI